MKALKTRRYAHGGALKFLEDGNTIGGYLISFTDSDNRDLDNEYFNKNTDLSTPHGFVGLPLLFHHGLDSKLKDIPIGTVSKAEIDEFGVWAEAILNEREQYERFVAEWYAEKEAPMSVEMYEKHVDFIKNLIAGGKMGYSSGANPNTAYIDEDGWIAEWKTFEASATHTPAEAHLTRLTTLKSIADLFPTEAVEHTDTSEGIEDVNVSKGDNTADDNNKSDLEDKDTLHMLEEMNKSVKMTDEEYEKMVEDVVKEVMSRLNNDKAMDEEEEQAAEDEIQKAISNHLASLEDNSKSASEALLAAIEAIPSAIEKAGSVKAQRQADIDAAINDAKDSKFGKGLKGGSHSDKTPTIQVHSPYDNWEAEDFSFAVDLFSKAKQHPNIDNSSIPNVSFDEKFYREFADKALEAYNKRELEATPAQVKTFRAIKADEVMHSDLATYGDEHVPTSWRDQIWKKARRDNVVLPLFNAVEMPTNPYVIPVESTDPTVYNIPETEDQAQLSLTASPIPDSQIVTSNVTLTAGKLGLLTFISGELAEDAVRDAIPTYRAQATRAILDSIDNVILNGDNATSGNVNLDGGTPGATAKYMIWDGLIVNALVTNSTNAVSAAGANPTLAAIRSARFKLDRSKQNVANLAIVTHPEVEAGLLGMDEFVTMDKAGSRATNMTGQIGVIDGIPVFVSNEIALADTDGKITDGGNVTDTGRLLVVNRPSWYVGYRRRVTTTLEYRAGWDSWHMTSTVRIAFIGQDGDSVSVLYNIAV